MTDSVQAPSPNAAAPALEGEAAFTRWQRMGNALRAGYVVTQRLARGLVTAVHSHPHEQITIVEQGRVRFVVDDQEHVASAGDVLQFPSHVRHGATMLDEEVVLIDIFTPVRDDFLGAVEKPTLHRPPGAGAISDDERQL